MARFNTAPLCAVHGQAGNQRMRTAAAVNPCRMLSRHTIYSSCARAKANLDTLDDNSSRKDCSQHQIASQFSSRSGAQLRQVTGWVKLRRTTIFVGRCDAKHVCRLTPGPNEHHTRLMRPGCKRQVGRLMRYRCRWVGWHLLRPQKIYSPNRPQQVVASRVRPALP